MNVNGLRGINNVGSENLGLLTENNKNNSLSFKDFLNESVSQLNQLEKESEIYSLKLAAGELDNIHEAMIASQKADIAMQFTMQIRNKLLEAYREIMRMQI